MNKRSATIIAATLVGVLVIGGTAFSLDMTGPTASAATDQTPSPATDPLVRTHTRTIVVHRQASSSASATPVASPSSGPSTSSGPGHDGDDFDDHRGHDGEGHHGDDDHDDDDHGDDDHGHHGGGDHDDDHGGHGSDDD
jgi:hypothetical protein